MKPETKSKSRKIIRIVVIITIVYLLYMATLQPLVAALTIPAIEHTGIELYTENKYLKFRHGEVFQECVEYIPLANDAEVKSFAYYDSRWRNNFFYGCYPNVYLLDVHAGQEYDNIKEFIISNGQDLSHRGEAYLFYWLEEAPGESDDCFMVALYDGSRTVRCILLTNYGNTISDARDSDSTLFMYYPIDLDVDPK